MLNTEDPVATFIMGILVGMFMIALIMILALSNTSNRYHQEAIAAGHAKWVADTNGVATFMWNKPCGDKE